VAKPTAGKRRSRFMCPCLDGPLDEPRARVLRKNSDPDVERYSNVRVSTHWADDRCADGFDGRALRVEPERRRTWRAFGFEPRRAESFRLSEGPLSIEKVWDVVGLCLHLSDFALVLCADDKTRPVAAMKKTNQHPKPFIWSEAAGQTLASVGRSCKRTSHVRHEVDKS
jgi:hypothetical protein